MDSAVTRRELELRSARSIDKPENQRLSRWNRPLFVAVVVATIALIGNLYVASSNQQAAEALEAAKAGPPTFLNEWLANLPSGEAREKAVEFLQRGLMPKLDARVMNLFKEDARTPGDEYQLSVPITVAWDANVEDDTAGYIVLYQGTNGRRGARGVGFSTKASIAQVRPGMRYAFRVVAFNSAGWVSKPSTEVTTVAKSRCDFCPKFLIMPDPLAGTDEGF